MTKIKSIFSLLIFLLLSACGEGDSMLPETGEIFGGTGTVELNWVPPTTYTDGTVLDDLDCYNIYARKEDRWFIRIQRIDNPGISSVVIGNLAPGRIYFAVTACNSLGVESSFSNEVMHAI